MRVVFMGTPDFAVPSLEALDAAHDVVGVVCRPDRPAGRGRRVSAPPVKVYAEAHGLHVLQPERLDPEVIDSLASLAPDIVCVAAYGAILPAAALEVAPHGAVNVHASLLPRYRGAAPIERAILSGDDMTGVSIMRVEESLDTGPVVSTVCVQVDDHTVESLTEVLARVGAEALVAAVAEIQAGTARWVPQDDALATYAQKVSAVDVALHPELDVESALRRVRASSRRAPARLLLCGAPATIVSASAEEDLAARPGEVVTGRRLLALGFSDGAVKVDTLRPENRGEMPGSAYVCGLQGRSTSWSGLA